MKLLLAFLAVPVLLLAGLFAAIRLPVFGAHPSAADREAFAASPRYDAAEGRFENRRPDVVADMRENGSVVRLLQEFLAERPDGEPVVPLPEGRPDMDAFLEPADSAKLVWFGHSTFLLNIDGTTVLVDPVFGDTASPVSFIAPRFQRPVLSLGELPPVDVILLSHDHYDHLDMPSIRHFAGTATDFVAPLGVGAHLERWGVDPARIVERDWWESHVAHGITFTATPSQHFSGRDGINNDETLWASWVLAGNGARVFFSGDSGYDVHFAEIGERLGPFDVAVLENGQYDAKWRAVHLLPPETVRAFEDLGAARLMPVHWGMFELAFHTWFEPPVALAALAEARGIELITPRIGDVVTLDADHGTSAWWEPLLPERGADVRIGRD